MNILQLSLLLAILLKCVTASESGVAQDVIDALGQPGFGRIRDDWRKWSARNDLFDHVVMKSVEFIARFINQVERVKRRTLAALFIKRSDIVDQVLENIEYNDDDLIGLTTCRPELAEPKSHENFFKAIDKIKKPKNQEWAVKWGVINLFDAKQHGLVISLINALEKRSFNGRNLKNVAIQKAFQEGALNGIKHIVEKFHEHTAITSDEYASGLINSWENDKSMVFPFLLAQADQGDLKVKTYAQYKQDLELRDAIDDAFSKAEPAGSRHARPAERERVRLAKEAFTGIQGLEPLGKEDTLGGIISGYILG